MTEANLMMMMMSKYIFWFWILMGLCANLIYGNKNTSNLNTEYSIHWGHTFGTQLTSQNVIMGCKSSLGTPVCCEAIDDKSVYANTSRGVGNAYEDLNHNYRHLLKHPEKCEIFKTYYSSPQELREFDMSMRISRIQNEPTRFKSIMEYVTSSEYIANATKWLDRVSLHMKNPKFSHVNDEHHVDDLEFLSYFHITKKCESGKSMSWLEWIEPLSITARHPFAYSGCDLTQSYYKNKFTPSGRDLTRNHYIKVDADYVLLQSGVNLHHHHYDSDGYIQHNLKTVISRNSSLDYFNSTKFSSNFGSTITIHNKGSVLPKFYMLDAGTSTFQSSLSWFTCGYSQNKVSFDQVYGWELTLLEPRNYWAGVPEKWVPYWHFYDIPVSLDDKEHNSPVYLIKTTAYPQDFVSFKLDIDTPTVEVPIALELLKDPMYAHLVDEFFFELHFRCEIMGHCGWDPNPSTDVEITLDRVHTLKYFIELRQIGIRSHIWL